MLLFLLVFVTLQLSLVIVLYCTYSSYCVGPSSSFKERERERERERVRGEREREREVFSHLNDITESEARPNSLCALPTHAVDLSDC